MAIVDEVPTENDLEYMFDVFTEEVEDCIKPEFKSKFNEHLHYLYNDIYCKFDKFYDYAEAIDMFLDEIGE